MDGPISKCKVMKILNKYVYPASLLLDVTTAIDNLPPARPEIIRCKDCRFWKKYKYFNGKPTYAPFCGFSSLFTNDNDFCSRAEKRGEADGKTY